MLLCFQQIIPHFTFVNSNLTQSLSNQIRLIHFINHYKLFFFIVPFLRKNCTINHPKFSDHIFIFAFHPSLSRAQ